MYEFVLCHVSDFIICEPKPQQYSQPIYRKIEFTFDCFINGHRLDENLTAEIKVDNACLENWGKDHADEWKKHLYWFLRESNFGLHSKLKKGFRKKMTFILANGSLALTIGKFDFEIGNKFAIKVKEEHNAD